MLLVNLRIANLLNRHSVTAFCFSALLLITTAEACADSSGAGLLYAAFEDETCDQLKLSIDQETELNQVYKSNEYRYFWLENEVPNASSGVLLAELKRSAAHGLRPEFYEYELLNAYNGQQLSVECFEILLSKAFVLYANDIANGYVRADKYPEQTAVLPIDVMPSILLGENDTTARLRDILRSLLTTDSRYVRLISKLAEFLRIEKLDVWPELRNLGSSENPALDPDKVRELLVFTGDLQARDLSKAERNSQEYKQAIARFQARHGLEVTRKVDAATFREMTMPLSKRIESILINLERRRWQNRSLGENHVYINLADKSVRFIRDGDKQGNANLSSIASMRELPTFSGKVSALGLSDRNTLELYLRSDMPIGSGKEFKFEIAGEPEKNLRYLLGSNTAQNLNLDEQVRLPIKSHLNAFVTYLTVWANKDGTINFRPDVFERDAELSTLLELSK